MRCQPLRRAFCLIHKISRLWLSIPLSFRSGFVGNSVLFSLPNEVAMYQALKNRSDCRIVLLSLCEVSIVGSSRFEQFGAFT